MTVCPPKVPQIEKIPDRQAARLPDNGDPAVREGARRKRLATRSMILPTLGAPTVTGASLGA